jgi:hypothetical protein
MGGLTSHGAAWCGSQRLGRAARSVRVGASAQPRRSERTGQRPHAGALGHGGAEELLGGVQLYDDALTG